LSIVDLAYGDCGKGTIADFLTRQTGAHTIVRFNGGPQAAHHVVTSDGRQHAFSQFGSGSFIPGTRTLLSRFILIEPYALLNEANHLADLGVHNPLDNLYIDARCPVITPAHQAANRLREIARGNRAHGTCGMGVGEAMLDLIEHPEILLYAQDLADRSVVAGKLRAIRAIKADQFRDSIALTVSHPNAQFNALTLLDDSWISAATDNYAELARHAHVVDPATASRIIGAPGTVIFEGAQGVLLDQTLGFHPHTTWSNSTFANAQILLDESGHRGRRTRIGVLRTYFTRHGAGPFVTENLSLSRALPESHNSDIGWQGRFRVGVFDAVAARYALAVAGGVDALAMTHLDLLNVLPREICLAYCDDPATLGLENESVELPVAQASRLCSWPQRHSRDGCATSYPELPSRISDDGFIRRENLIVDIDPNRNVELAASELFTSKLANCRPIFSPAPTHDADGFVETMQAHLRVPIVITSTGPTAEDKTSRIHQW